MSLEYSQQAGLMEDGGGLYCLPNLHSWNGMLDAFETEGPASPSKLKIGGGQISLFLDGNVHCCDSHWSSAFSGVRGCHHVLTTLYCPMCQSLMHMTIGAVTDIQR